MLEVVSFPHQILGNTYVVTDGNEAFIFDMGINYSKIKAYLDKRQITPKAIFLTHGHYDHIIGLSDFDNSIPLYIGYGDLDYLTDPCLNLGQDMFGEPLCLDEVKVQGVEESDAFKLGKSEMKIIETPFHTKGSLCFYFPGEDILISGDALFRLSIGRSDLPGAAPRMMDKSLAKLTALPDKTMVYPGHGKKSDLGFEKANNPFLI